MKDNMDNGLDPIIAQAIAEMKAEAGNNFQLEKINLAELGRRTGISRAKLRRLKENGFKNKPHGLSGRKAPVTLLSGYSSMLDAMLKAGCTSRKPWSALYNRSGRSLPDGLGLYESLGLQRR